MRIIFKYKNIIAQINTSHSQKLLLYYLFLIWFLLIAIHILTELTTCVPRQMIYEINNINAQLSHLVQKHYIIIFNKLNLTCSITYSDSIKYFY